MSKKPKKKSDLNKQWMNKRRSRGIQMPPQYHLIVTEGKKTEPYYFKALQADINNRFPGHIHMEIKGRGEGTTKLLEYAQNFITQSLDGYSHIWLVYDKDNFPKEDFDNTAKECEELSNDTVTYHALWSNECIEYWFLLHFSYLDSALSRKEYAPKLTDCLGFSYKKNNKEMYDILKPKLSQAIKNAERIMKKHGSAPPSDCTPGTKVYELFEELISYLDK